MGGPGVDPHWNGTTTEAYNWGARQAAETLVDIKGRYIPYPVIWADIELPGIAPAPDNGWNSVYTSICSGHVRQAYVPAAVDRAEFNGFAAYITSHSRYKVGVYSAARDWRTITGDWVAGVDADWVANRTTAACTAPGFSGDPVWLVQEAAGWPQPSGYDSDWAC